MVEQAGASWAGGGGMIGCRWSGQAGIDSDKCQIHMEERRGEERAERRQRKHPLGSSPARSECFIKEKNIK